MRTRHPEIDNFGRRFFLELAGNDWRYQVSLVKRFIETLQSAYQDLYTVHNLAVSYYINEEMDDEQQEKLAIFESNLISSSDD